MSKLQFRPEGYKGLVEQDLPRVQHALDEALAQAQKGLRHDTRRLDRPALKTLAAILVEFAEDLHCEIGIWQALKRSQTEFFGTPLPFVIDPSASPPLDGIRAARLQYFLWAIHSSSGRE
jgi:hypothetical protein